MPIKTPTRSLHHLHSSRLGAVPLDELLAMIVSAADAADLDRALRTARAQCAGSVLEQLKCAAKAQANFVLNTLYGAPVDA